MKKQTQHVTDVEAQAEADATDEVGYAVADQTYQDALWSDYAQQLQSLIPNPKSPSFDPSTAALAQYYASVALDESGQLNGTGPIVDNC